MDYYVVLTGLTEISSNTAKHLSKFTGNFLGTVKLDLPNIKKIDNIVFASPSKSRIRNLQSIGRGLRKVEGKDSMRLFDIADDLQNDNYTLKHCKDRINIYNEENFPYEIKQFDLK